MKQVALLFSEKYPIEWESIRRLLFVGGGVDIENFADRYPQYKKFLRLSMKTFQQAIPEILVSEVLFSEE